MEIFESISRRLINQPCIEVGKAGMTLWIAFGRTIIAKIGDQKREERRLYYLHIQSPWRFQEKGKIILASGDMYRCFDKAQPFDIGNDCNSIYDHRVKVINDKLAYGVKVVDVHVAETGDITLLFENQLSFQGFIDDSTEDEYWRFISYEKEESEHIVFHDID